MEIDHSLRPSLVGAELGDDASFAGTAASSREPGEPSQLDGRTVAYVLKTRGHFDLLRQAAGQLAGLLVLAVCGVKAITPEHAVLTSAESAHAEAAAELRRLDDVPDRAKHHHHHLVLALDLIDVALARCRKDIAAYGTGRRDVDEALRPLKSGYAHLQHAAALLPGFEILAFSQGCCASHPAVQKPTRVHT